MQVTCEQHINRIFCISVLQQFSGEHPYTARDRVDVGFRLVRLHPGSIWLNQWMFCRRKQIHPPACDPSDPRSRSGVRAGERCTQILQCKNGVNWSRAVDLPCGNDRCAGIPRILPTFLHVTLASYCPTNLDLLDFHLQLVPADPSHPCVPWLTPAYPG